MGIRVDNPRFGGATPLWARRRIFEMSSSDYTGLNIIIYFIRH
jgi:hypothetical protein